MFTPDDPITRDSLMMRLKDGADQQAWNDFVEIYRPLVYRYARRRGLQDADAHDLVQRVLASVYSTIDRWDEPGGSGRFRAWLSRVSRNAVIDAFRRVRPDAAKGGTTVLKTLANHSDDGDAIEEAIEREYQCEVFRWAARRVRSQFDDLSWQAFWLTSIVGEPAREVSAKLGKSVGAVYTARSKIISRLREKVLEHEASG